MHLCIPSQSVISEDRQMESSAEILWEIKNDLIAAVSVG